MMFPTGAQADGEGIGGSAAACAEIFEGLGMTWWARGKQAHFGYPIFKVEHCSSLYSWFVACATHYAGAGIPNFEPFDGVETLSFWIKNKGSPGSSLPIRVSLERWLPKRVCNLIIKSPGSNVRSAYNVWRVGRGFIGTNVEKTIHVRHISCLCS